ncbi:MAG TPA: hypothetical protein VNT50_02490 [Microbacterium sp.]|nr:hypothetical protein [Microbacterium sp.]HWI30333.1 hypothetical protein [Microbacterium sp.]
MKLTPAPGTATEPVAADEIDDARADAAPPAGAGPNDEQLRRDVPPHY